jgi:hypothetical protein
VEIQDRAIVFTPSTGNIADHVDRCLEACKREGIEVVGVLPPDRDDLALQMWAERKANMMVVARRDHIPENFPRIMVAAEHPADAKTRHRNQTPVHRRPHRI